MKNIPNGTYFMKTFYGKSWNSDTIVVPGVSGFFEESVSFDKADAQDDLILLSQRETAREIKYATFEITLYAVLNGNLETEDISFKEFFKNDD